jgi:penicillin-binding protein 1A
VGTLPPFPDDLPPGPRDTGGPRGPRGPAGPRRQGGGPPGARPSGPRPARRPDADRPQPGADVPAGRRPRPGGGAPGGRPPGGGNGRGGRGGGGGGRGPRDPDGPDGFGPGPHDREPTGRTAFGRQGDGQRKRSIIWRWRRPFFLIGLAMLALLAGVGVVLAQTELPTFDDLAQSSYICAGSVPAGECSGKNAMTRLQADENRTNVPLEEVPEVVIQAVIAMEDRNFFEHDGVNPVGVARAMFQNVKGGGVSQGGSTITQQYVKNAFKLSTERAISRKVKEAVLSLKLEQQMSKEEILEGYLNTIFFGRGAYGIAAASQAYFGIDVREMTDAGQAAMLAGIIRAPALAEPSKHPEEATRRRQTALVAMQEEGYITAEQADLLGAVPVAEPWVRPYSSVKLTETLRGASDNDYMGTDYLAPYIEAELMRINPERFTEEVIDQGGLRIYTSLDYEMQRAAWNAVASTLNQEDDPATPEWEGDPEASMVAVDDQGLVRAMVGGRHRYTPGGEFQANYAVRGNGSDGREPGSTFKPVVLAQALLDGYSLESRYNAQGTMEFDQPEVRDPDGNPWKVSNYSESDAGVMDLVRATNQSSNTAYAQLMLDLGLDMVDPDGDGKSVVEGPSKVATLAEQMGVMGGDIPDENTSPAMVLGTVNATPLEMAGVYSTFANRGTFKQPDIITRVEQVDQSGKTTVLYERQVKQTQIMSEEKADLITHALQTVLEPGGTAADANLGKPAAGKTGTSQRNRNAWFAGYVPKLTAVVWMGYPKNDYVNPETGRNELWPMNEDGRLVHGRTATGGSFPAEIWKKFMEVATAGMEDQFVEVTPEQIAGGEALHEDELLTPEEQATSIPEMPDISMPDITRPGGPGGGPRPTRPDDTTTSTDDPDDTTTSSSDPPITIMPPDDPD